MGTLSSLLGSGGVAIPLFAVLCVKLQVKSRHGIVNGMVKEQGILLLLG